MHVKNTKFYGIIQFIIDIAIIDLGYIIAFYFRSQELWEVFIAFASSFLIYTSAIAGGVFLLYRPYRCGLTTYSETIFNSFISVILIAIGLILFDYAVDNDVFWRSAVLNAILIQFAFFLITKAIIYKLFFTIYRKVNAMIVGQREDGLGLAVKLIGTQKHLYNLKYLVIEDMECIEHKIMDVDEIFCCGSMNNQLSSEITQLALSKDKTVHVVSDSSHIFDTSGLFSKISDIPAITYSNKMTQESRLTKRLIDILLAIIVTVLTCPLMLIVAIGIKAQDGGTIFFKQERVTIDNRQFKLIKFRTMVMNAEKQTGAVLAQKNDQRITALGHFLRTTRIDELPQVWNVLCGDMSMIGPRPERPELIEEIIKEIPEFATRTKMKAGITGLAQVMGRYNTTAQDKLLFDLYYIKNYSLFLDLRILFYTTKIVFTKSSSEGILDHNANPERQLEQLGYTIVDETSKIIELSYR